MASPFRYNKKARKRWRQNAKSARKRADKFEAEGIKTPFVSGLRSSADLCVRMAQMKRRKKTKSKKSK
jgi:hypothetical protein